MRERSGKVDVQVPCHGPRSHIRVFLGETDREVSLKGMLLTSKRAPGSFELCKVGRASGAVRQTCTRRAIANGGA